ncbi:serine/threonine protein kinase [Chloroflexales bacterium ZM16-3]|nr:serine/threonine protein kinase [Chloroflexales bacterium ZM16-3]
MPFPTSNLVQTSRFRHVRVIGKGAFGQVYYAEDNLHRKVAVKEILPTSPGFANARDRFERESRIHAQVQHANIISVYHLEEDQQTKELYLVCEYADGGSLADYLQAYGPLTEQQAIKVSIDICIALDATWAHQIIHRDVKPSNIMLKLGPQSEIVAAKLGDFGIAQDQHSTRTTIRQGASHPGTPLYMAPEQSNAVALLDVRADIYALGIVLWEMLTGVDYKPLLVQGSNPSLRQYNPAASAWMAAIIARAVQNDLNIRYRGPREMWDDLVNVRDGKQPAHALKVEPTQRIVFPAGPTQPMVQPLSSPVAQVARPTRRGVWLAPTLLAVILLVGLLAVMLQLFSPAQAQTPTLTPIEAPTSTPTIADPTAVAVVLESGCLVPNVVGEPVAAADGLISGNGLRSVHSSAYDSGVAQGLVLRQTPAGGTRLVPCQGDVTIVVGLGSPPVTVTATTVVPSATLPPPPTATLPPPPTATLPPPPTATLPPIVIPVTSVTVQANAGWNGTGYDVQPGDQIQIVYRSGLWTYWTGHIAPTDGRGDLGYICAHIIPASQCVEPIPDVAKGALIARIGDGAPIYIGNDATIVSTAAGQLQLGINDTEFGDNTGALNVEIIGGRSR